MATSASRSLLQDRGARTPVCARRGAWGLVGVLLVEVVERDYMAFGGLPASLLRTFERTRELARVNELAYIYRDQPDFSARIRKTETPAIARREPWR